MSWLCRWFRVGCPSPPPPPPDPPLAREVHVSVWGPDGLLMANLVTRATLIPEPLPQLVILGQRLPGENRLRFVLPANVPYTWGAQLHLEAKDYVALDERVFLAQDLNVQMAYAHVDLPRLVVAGQHLRQVTGVTGAIFTAVQCSDFNLAARIDAGDDVHSVLAQRQAAGFNMLRVWTSYDIPRIGTFKPHLHPRSYDAIAQCADLASRYGFYVQFTGFASPRDVFTSEDQQVIHWEMLSDIARGRTNVLLELDNEGDQAANAGLAYARMARPLGVLASRGSLGSQQAPSPPHWDYVNFHTNGAFEEQRKVGHNAWKIWSGPTLTNETSRYPEVGMWVGASLERQKTLAFDSAAGAALLCAGSCFHSVHGKTSQLWDANELAVATAWAAGAQSVDLSFQNQPYRHRIDLETPDILRAYQRRTSPVVKIHR